MRRIALCILVPGTLVLTAMSCVSVWHNELHPKIRPGRFAPEGVGVIEFQRGLWLFSTTNVRGSDLTYGGIGWNRRNIVAVLCMARPLKGENLSQEYWQRLKRGTNDLLHSELRVRQASTLRFEKEALGRLTGYWCFIPLWLAWAVVSAYPIFVISKSVLVRRLRRKRGQCLTCAYDLRGNVSNMCSECGTPLPHPSRATRRGED